VCKKQIFHLACPLYSKTVCMESIWIFT